MGVRCAAGHMGPALQGSLQYCGRTGASVPTVLRNEEERRGGALPLPRAGKSAKRRRWRMQRAGFEEVPRLADATVAGNRLARRWAREPRPYGSVTRGAMGGRPQGSPLRKRCKECDFYRAGRCGERTERCQWQRKRSERVAAVKILSVRRKAAQKFWTPQQGHRPLRGEFGENKRKKQEDTGVSSCF